MAGAPRWSDGSLEIVMIGNTFSIFHFQLSILLNGVYSDGDPPLPIPNREVKPVSADGTAERWESRSMPDLEKSDSEKSRSFFMM